MNPTTAAPARRDPSRPILVPPIEVVGPDGRTWTISPASDGDTVADVARALGLPGDGLCVEGVAFAGHERLTSIAGLVTGARIDPPPAGADGLRPSSDAGFHRPGASVSVGSAVAELAVVAGPATSPWRPLGAGRHVVGRSRSAAVRIHDPALEPHHGLLDVADDGTVTFRQLTGVHVARRGGHPCDGATALDPGEWLEVGSSIVVVRRPPGRGGRSDPPAVPPSDPRSTTVPTSDDPWRRVFRRAHAGPPADWAEVSLTVPSPPAAHPAPPVTGLVGGIVGVIGAVVLAVVLGHAGFALFALVGAAASFASWAVGALGARRRRRADRGAHERAAGELARDLEALHDERRHWHAAHHPTVVDALDALDALAVDRPNPAVVDPTTAAGDRTSPAGDRPSAAIDRPTAVGDRPGPAAEAVEPVTGTGPKLWGRRPDGARVDRMRATVGVGDHPWTVPVAGALPPDLLRTVERCGRLPNVAAPVTVDRGAVDAVTGPGRSADAVVRAVLVQLATWYGPADWALAVVTSDPAGWEWIRWLPHTARIDGGPAVLTPTSADDLGRVIGELEERRLLVVVTDDRDGLAEGASPVRRAVAAGAVAVLAALDLEAPAPACCRRVLEVGSTGRARWSGPCPSADSRDVDEGDGPATAVRVAGLDAATTLEAARRLAPLVDPEAVGADTGLPAAVGLFELIGGAPSARSVAASWKAGGPDAPPAAPLGLSRDGVVTIDLCRDGPHALVAGTTGSGKSELLRTLVASLALHVGPDQLTFVLVDYKGGATFDACTRLPHVVGLVTDLEAGGAERALTSLEAELRHRERLLRDAGASDLTAYRAAASAGPLPRLVVVVDEFAALARELPELLRRLVDVAQRGRSLGVHLVLATQRPAGVVSDDIRANTALRLALRLPDPADAHDVVDDPAPVAFPRAAPGRAAMRLGPDELTTFQAARCTIGAIPTEHRLVAVPAGTASGRTGGPGPGRTPGSGRATGQRAPTQLDHVVAVVDEAVRLTGCAEPRRPWREPLPALLRPDDIVEAGLPCVPPVPPAIGLVDDPAAQAVHPLAWDPTSGNLGLLGSVGSGLTSTLIALVTAWCGRWPPGELGVYVVDGHGDDRLDALAAIEHCAAVVRIHESERLGRLLGRVATHVDRAREGRRSQPGRTVLVVDGVGPLRAALGADPGATVESLLERVVREGPPVGVTTVLADHGTAATAWPMAERWVFHLDDPTQAAAFGVRVPPVPDGVPGRLRLASSGLEAQVARGADGLAALPARTGRVGPADVAVLPPDVPAEVLEGGATEPPAPTVERFVLGLDADQLGVAWLDVPHGDHVLVAGPARSGVSTALRRLAVAWERRHGPDGVRWLRGGVDCVAVLDELVGTDGPDATGGDDGPFGEDATDGCVGESRRRLLVVDDAHRIDDARLVALARGARPGVTLVAGARAEAVRAAFGHWTRDVARGGCGIVMTAPGTADGELLGASLPSRTLVAARPGLGWVVDGSGSRLVQIARDRPASDPP